VVLVLLSSGSVTIVLPGVPDVSIPGEIVRLMPTPPAGGPGWIDPAGHMLTIDGSLVGGVEVGGDLLAGAGCWAAAKAGCVAGSPNG